MESLGTSVSSESHQILIIKAAIVGLPQNADHADFKKNESSVRKKKSTQSARSAQSAWSARSVVCSLLGLRFGVTRRSGFTCFFS